MSDKRIANNLETIEINTTENQPNSSVIWLHGLGADGYDFAGIVPELQLPKTIATRFILPHAPFRHVTVCGNMRVRAWFNIEQLSMETPSTIDITEINASQTSINELIEHEIARGIPSNRIFLAGFSQGAAMALHCGISYTKALGGIIALSGFLASATALEQHNSANRNIPIFMAHGTNDPVVPFALHERARDALQQAGYSLTIKKYTIQHTVCTQEIAHISTWLQEQLQSTNK